MVLVIQQDMCGRSHMMCITSITVFEKCSVSVVRIRLPEHYIVITISFKQANNNNMQNWTLHFFYWLVLLFWGNSLQLYI